MAFVSNQWVGQGIGVRARSHTPVPVDLGLKVANGQWDRDNSVVVELIARRRSGEFQVLLLQEEEVGLVVEKLRALRGDEDRAQGAVQVLAALPDADLLSAIQRIFALRGR